MKYIEESKSETESGMVGGTSDWGKGGMWSYCSMGIASVL
jgi:hypothetical protein